MDHWRPADRCLDDNVGRSIGGSDRDEDAGEHVTAFERHGQRRRDRNKRCG